jgi:hypothetical protein
MCLIKSKCAIFYFIKKIWITQHFIFEFKNIQTYFLKIQKKTHKIQFLLLWLGLKVYWLNIFIPSLTNTKKVLMTKFAFNYVMSYVLFLQFKNILNS